MKFILLLALAATSSSLAQPVDVAPWMTGEQLVGLLKWPAGVRDNFDLSIGQRLDRTAAKNYIVGVHDATEGKAWCWNREYKPKPDVIQDQVYEGLLILTPAQRKRNAAALIAEILAAKYPCTPGRKP